MIPAISYLGDSSTSQEALACLRRDLVSEETSCEPEYRARIWEVLLLDQDEFAYSRDILQASHERAQAIEDRYMQAKPDDAFDPLSESESWATYYKDQDLRKVITQDCQRIFPDEDWFQGATQQRILQDCLFLWSKEKSEISYRQGMHEIAGIVLWVVMHDSQYKAKEKLTLTASYTLFEAVMRSMKDFYSTSQDGTPNILSRTSKIQHELLPVLDHVLSARLLDLGIEPQLYCMRWLRLLFSREFPFEDVLVLWDILFAADKTLTIADHVCCAMVMRVRESILKHDYNHALTSLMSYPQPKTAPSSFLQDALHLRNFFTPIAGSEIIERYHEGTIVNSKPLELTLRSGPAVSYSIGALLERTDVLGINDYVRGAVEEVRRNVTPLISETRHVLARPHSRDRSTVSRSPITPSNTNMQRDRELASIIALAVANLKRGESLESNMSRLEDVKMVLQGRKTLAQLNNNEEVESPQLRPSSAPQTRASPSAARRALSPIRMPAIRSKAKSPSRAGPVDIQTDSSNFQEAIPLFLSPKRSSLKKASDFPFLFGEDEPAVSTFNRSRHS